MHTCRLSARALVLLAFLLALAAGPLAASAAPPATPPGQSGKHHAEKVCSDAVASGEARCHAQVQVDDVTKKAFAFATPAGYGPADLKAAYAIPSATTAPTVAIVDAYDDPRAESDLGTYRSTFGLPACTTRNGCFRKINQSGGTRSPKGDTGWAEEISLDLDMVSAICPNCHILLVEANSNSFNDLAAAVDYAATRVPGVVAISNSYGGGEWNGEQTFQSHYNHPGKAITASTGDSGYGVEFPAAAASVTAVGGTTLTRSGGTFSETAWSGAGSGCSAYIAKPSWQTGTADCANRSVADVSAIADPNTGVAVYDTYGTGGWLVFGGTSVASPIIASVYALAGNTASITGGSYAYGHPTSLNDVMSGSNGSCGGTYLCTSGTGYDGPTGLGTPKGTGGF
jgi:subtilase family serine protease